MSDQPNTTTSTPAAPAVPAVVTPAHISALHQHLEEVKSFLVAEFHKVAALVSKAGAFVQKEAPEVLAAAGAVASAVPGLAPAAAVVSKVVAQAATVACCLHIHPGVPCPVAHCPCTASSAPAKT